MADIKTISRKVQAWGKDYRNMKAGRPVGNAPQKRTIDRERYDKAMATARPKRTLDTSRLTAKSNKAIATASARNKGTYYSYDPLTSTSQNLRVRKMEAATSRSKRYSAKTNRMAANLRKAEAAGKTNRAKRLSRKITRRERGDSA